MNFIKGPCERQSAPKSGVALVMVLLVLGALALLGAPFVISMALQERSSFHFDGEVKVRLAAEAAAHHAVATLTETVRSTESAREAEERLVFGGRAERSTGDSGTKRLKRSRGRSGRGGSIRREGSEGTRRRDKESARKSRDRDRDTDKDGGEDERLSPLRQSARGPLSKDFDLPSELGSPMLSSVVFPVDAPRIYSQDASSLASMQRKVEALTVDFQNQRGIAASAEVVDEQGKININTAPPNLIANLFASSQLRVVLDKRDRVIELEDASAFSTDADTSNIDGAVVVVHPVTGRIEAITYQDRSGNTLEGIFRGAFFSTHSEEEFPKGSSVYDLRGWKAGYHRLRAGPINGFVTRELAEFSTVEAIREIANWQVSSLFLERLGGQRLTESFLQENGIRTRDLEKSGIDPSLFQSDRRYSEGIFKIRLEDARKTLRRLRIRRSLIDKLESARGPRAVVALAARLDGLDRKAARKEAKGLEAMLKTLKRKSPNFDRKYLRACLANLARVQRSSGVETLRPQDLEQLLDMITVHSWVPVRWSESQILPDNVIPGDQTQQSYSIERSEAHGGGGIVRLRHRESNEIVELNQTIQRDKNVPARGFSLVFPVFRSFQSRTARIDFLERHPVNINTASERVLIAIFTGIRDARVFKRVKDKTPGVVTPAEARAFARFVVSQRPFRGPKDFRNAVFLAVDREVVDEEDSDALYINSVQPNHYRLRTSTTGFCYATGDVYTVRGRGILRNLAGGEVTSTAFREVVEVSSARSQQWILFGQSDFSSEIYVRNPYPQDSYSPENHFLRSISLPGSRGHLVRSTPILYKLQQSLIYEGEPDRKSHRFFAVPGGELGSLRLEVPETPNFRAGPEAIRRTIHFRNRRDEMLNLGDGDPYAVDISMELEDGQDLTNTLGSSVEAWIRFRTFPASTDEGMFYVMDAGASARRNRLSVLYDPKLGEWVARIYDSTASDPDFASASATSDIHQWVELRHKRELELHTWYHVRLAWDGAYPGGVQLFVDGFPAEGSNLRSELKRNLSTERDDLTRGDVKDWGDKFPISGVLRINQELFEYSGLGKLRTWYGDSNGTGGGYSSYFEKYAADSLRERREKYGLDPHPNDQSAPAVMRGAKPPDPNDVSQGHIYRDNGNRRGTVRANHKATDPVTLHGYSLELRKRLEIRAANGNVTYHAEGGEDVVLGEGGLTLGEELLPFNLPEYFTRTDETYADSRYNKGRYRRVRLVNFAERLPLEDSPREVVEKDRQGRDHVRLHWPHSLTNPAAIPGVLTPVFYMTLRGSELNLPENRRLLPPACAAFVNMVRLNAPVAPVEVYTGSLQIDGQIISAHRFFQRLGGIVDVDVDGEPSMVRYSAKMGVRPGHPGAVVGHCKALIAQGRGARIVVDCNLVNPQRDAVLMVSLFCGPAEESLLTTTAYPNGQIRGSFFDHARRLTLNSIRASGQLEGRYPKSGVIELRGFPPPWQTMDDSTLNLDGRAGDARSALASDLFTSHPDDATEWIRYYDIDGDMFVARPRSMFRDFPRAVNQENLRQRLNSATIKKSGVPEPRRVENQLWHEAQTPIFQVVEVTGGGVGHGDYVTVSSKDPDIVESQAWRIYNVLEMSSGRYYASLVHPFGQNSSLDQTYTRSMRPRLEKFPSGYPPRVGKGRITFFGDSVVPDTSPGMPTAYSVEEEIASGFVIDEIRRTYGNRPQRDTRHVVVPLKNDKVDIESSGDFHFFTGRIEAERQISADNPLDVLVVSVGTAHQDFVSSQKQGVLRINEELFFFENPNASDSSGGGEDSAGGKLMRFQTRPKGGTYFGGSGSLESLDPGMRLMRWDLESGAGYGRVNVVGGQYEEPGFFRLEANHRNHEIVFYNNKDGNEFKDCLRGQFQTPMIARVYRFRKGRQWVPGTATIRNAAIRLSLVGRGLLGSPRQTHGLGDPIVRVNYLPITQVAGPMTDTGLPVTETQNFPRSGYLLLDPAQGARDYEILAYTGRDGEGMFRRPRGEDGRGILRGCFGTPERAINAGMFAYALPFRHFDRYEPLAEGEDIAHFQKSLRVPGAFFKSISWRERRSRNGQERLCDVVVAARFDGAPEWNAKPTNEPGGLYVFDAREVGSSEAPEFPLEVAADQIEVRVYFRYQEGAFQFLDNEGRMRDDWKETPVLDALTVEYGKSGRVLRYEETEF